MWQHVPSLSIGLGLIVTSCVHLEGQPWRPCLSRQNCATNKLLSRTRHYSSGYLSTHPYENDRPMRNSETLNFIWASYSVSTWSPCKLVSCNRGVHPSGTMQYFPPISSNWLDCQEKFRKWHFSMWFSPQNMSFHSPKFRMTLFSHRLWLSKFDIKCYISP